MMVGFSGMLHSTLGLLFPEMLHCSRHCKRRFSCVEEAIGQARPPRKDVRIADFRNIQIVPVMRVSRQNQGGLIWNYFSFSRPRRDR